MLLLLGELFVYLVAAAGIGLLAGWLLRGIQNNEAAESMEDRFRQMLASAEMERDAARIRVRELGYQLDAMEERVEILLSEGAAEPKPADDVPAEAGAQPASVPNPAPVAEASAPVADPVQEAPAPVVDPVQETPALSPEVPAAAPAPSATPSPSTPLEAAPLADPPVPTTEHPVTPAAVAPAAPATPAAPAPEATIQAAPPIAEIADTGPEVRPELAEPSSEPAPVEALAPAPADPPAAATVPSTSGLEESGNVAHSIDTDGTWNQPPVKEAEGATPNPREEFTYTPRADASEPAFGRPQAPAQPADDADAAELWRKVLEQPVSRWHHAGETESNAVEAPSPSSPVQPQPEAIPAREPEAVGVMDSSRPAASAGDRSQFPGTPSPTPSPTIPTGTLADLPGLPPEVRGSMEKLGISSTRMLAARTKTVSEQDDLASLLAVEPRMVRRWGGLADLMQVPGVGPDQARLLEATGLGSVVELADEDADDLLPRMSALNDDQGLALAVPSSARVNQWIQDARLMSGTFQRS